MKLKTMSFNKMRELEEFVNSEKIPQNKIVNIFPAVDKTFTLIYFCDE